MMPNLRRLDTMTIHKMKLRYDDFKKNLILSPSLGNLTTHIAIHYIHIPIIIKVQCVKHLIQIFIFFGMTIKLSGYICFCNAQWFDRCWSKIVNFETFGVKFM